MNSTNELGIEMQDVAAPNVAATPTSAKVVHGKVFPAQQQVLLFSPDEWEAFIEEWAQHLKPKYALVVRLGGPSDMGLDIAAFVDDKGLKGVWDNHQCKHYKDPLTPNDAVPEIGKLLWYAYKGHFAPPRKYYFMAPKNCGPSLKKLLLGPDRLKKTVLERWDDWCADAITSTATIALTGDFRKFVEAFDFSIVTFKTTLTVLDEHRTTPYYAARFGGGLPDRPATVSPPIAPAPTESRYLKQLFEAYSDHKGVSVAELSALGAWPELTEHYHRQREFFYHAESLREFARDTVPPGTFEDLQDEVCSGVIDVATVTPHADAFVRLTAVTQAAALLPLTANALITVTKIQDKRGICHQLANEDKLHWLKT